MDNFILVKVKKSPMIINTSLLKLCCIEYVKTKRGGGYDSYTEHAYYLHIEYKDESKQSIKYDKEEDAELDINNIFLQLNKNQTDEAK